MNCQEITIIISNIAGLKKTLDLAIKKELQVQEGLDSKKSIEISITEVEEATRMEFAEKLFGQDFLGPEQIKVAFSGRVEIPEKIPPIPFSKDELERSQKLGQMLILRVGRLSDGSKITMKTIGEALDEKVKDRGKVLCNTDWYKDEKFFTEDAIANGWTLVSKEVVPDSINKNYLEQTDALIAQLNQSFDPKSFPEEYVDATQKYALAKDEIAALMDLDWQKAAEKLEGLKINQMLRQTPFEALYDLVVYFQNTGKRLLENTYTWTNSRNPDGDLVCVGYFKSDGVRVDRGEPGATFDSLGVSFSRSR